MKLTIITINFNHLDGLRKTYESVMAQTFRDFEWIVIDGGSTDGSREFIEAHQTSFAHWCSEPDKGVYNAMNKGIVVANGEYLNFMNSGDVFFDERSLETVFSASRTADIVYGAMLMADGSLDHAPMMKPRLYWSDFYNDTLPHQASFIRRSLFDKVGLYDETFKISADWFFFANAFIHHGATTEFIPAVLARFEGSGISANGALAIKENERLRKEVFGAYLVPNYERTKFFETIHRHRPLAIIQTILYRLACWIDSLTNRTLRIAGYNPTSSKILQ